jgi:hypothetical protein
LRRSAIGFKGLASWIGFRQLRVDYEPRPSPWTHKLGPAIAHRPLGRRPDRSRWRRCSTRVCPASCSLQASRVQRLDLIEAFVYERTVPGYPSIIIGIMVIGGVPS